jgi:hypothetical protein
MTSTATPVSAAAEQQHQNNDNEDQFHGEVSFDGNDFKYRTTCSGLSSASPRRKMVARPAVSLTRLPLTMMKFAGRAGHWWSGGDVTVMMEGRKKLDDRSPVCARSFHHRNLTQRPL